MDSMGPRINTRTRKIGGSTVWFPRGPALRHFSDRIRPEVQRIVDNIELPEVETLIVKLYMIGRSEQKANPIIMICCSDKATRKEAEKSIRESGLLDQHGNRGFGLGSAGFPLETSFLPHPLGEVIYSEMRPSAEDTSEGSSALNIDVYGLTGSGIGRKLGFVAPSQSGPTIQYATGGPIMRLGGHLYQLTVAHAMNPSSSSKATQNQDWDTDECEFDGQSDEDEDENLILSRASTSPGEPMIDTEPESDQQDSQQSSNPSESYPEMPDTRFSGGQDLSASLASLKPVQTEHGDDEWDSSFLLGSFSMPCWNIGEMDYLMIKLPQDASDVAQDLNRITIDGPFDSRSIQIGDIAGVRADVINILAITSRGPIPGDIVPDSVSFKASGSSSFQQLLTVLLSKGLREGDSGSAVIDAQTGHFYGHIILGVDGDCVAYVLPSPNIMANITNQFLQLPSFHRANRDERPVSAPAAQIHRTKARTAVDLLSKLITGAGPSSSDQQFRPHEVSVPMDDLLTLQRELKDAWTAVDMLNTELRDKRSAPEGISSSGFVDVKPLRENAARKASPRPTFPSAANRMKTGADPTLNRTLFSIIADGLYCQGAKFLDAFLAVFPMIYCIPVLLSLGIIVASLKDGIASSGGGQADQLFSWGKRESTYRTYDTKLAAMTFLLSAIPLFMAGIVFRQSWRRRSLLDSIPLPILWTLVAARIMFWQFWRRRSLLDSITLPILLTLIMFWQSWRRQSWRRRSLLNSITLPILAIILVPLAIISINWAPQWSVQYRSPGD